MKVNVFVWKATKKELEIVNSVLKFIATKANVPLNFDTKDLSSFNVDSIISPTICFGGSAYTHSPSSKDTWRLPSILKLENTLPNKEYRAKTFSHLQAIVARLIDLYKEIEEPLTTHVETSEGVSVGVGLGDIQLTESEVTNLLKIKQLLNGSKIVLVKGDVRIEVE